MKNYKILIVVILLLICESGYSQWVHIHTHLNNRDRQTRSKLSRLTLTLIGRNATLLLTNRQLSKAIDHHRRQLKKNYTKNRFDKKNGFLVRSLGSATLSLGTSALGNYKRLPYMTEIKRDYLKSIALDKFVLVSLNNVSANKIKSGKRQEIYRLRNKIIRELSESDRSARKILFFSAAGLAVLNYEEFSELSRFLKAAEIVF